MNVSEESLIESLKSIQNTLDDNQLLTDEYNLTIAVLIAHLEDLKTEEEEN